LRRRHRCDHHHRQRDRESGLSHLGNLWAFRQIARPRHVEAWRQEDVAAGLMPFDLNSKTAQGHPRSAAATRHPSKPRDFIV
jgi:hypothetical protein